MNKKLQEQAWAVAQTVAQLFGEIIGMRLEHFVGDDPTETACFGDCYFFTVGEMWQVLQNLDRYVGRYGSREAVGEEIRDWVDWWMDSHDPDTARELVRARVTHQLRPNISLRAWLDGCPREDRLPWSGPDADYMRLQSDRDTLERLIREYRANRTLSNVLDSINTDLDREAEQKAKRDFDEWQRLKQGEAWQRFQKEVEGHTDGTDNTDF